MQNKDEHTTDTANTFTLLCIGQRGVGKTVFLAGSYLELYPDNQKDDLEKPWCDCQDNQVQANIEKITSYIAQTGEYPPLTTKFTNFSFSLQHHSAWGTQTSHLGWWDIPGESCNIEDLQFQSIMASSDACCVLIDAYALMHDSAYPEKLEDIITLVTATASLVSLNDLKYAFALVLTKCDLLKPGLPEQRQIEERLQPLIGKLNAMKANYQTFYSFIPIVQTAGAATLQPKGTAAAFLWLAQQLSQQRSSSAEACEIAETAKQKQLILPNLLLRAQKNLLLVLTVVAAIGVTGLSLWQYQKFRSEQYNLAALNDLSTLRQHGQFNQALPLVEKLVQQQPERLDLRLQLADLYELTGQVSKAEAAYDKVLTQQKKNLKALIGKAVLRRAQGDNKAASLLLAQAEAAAPASFKVKVRHVADKILTSHAE